MKMSLKSLRTKHTYCFRYFNIDKDICYVWIEALNPDVAYIKFKEECPECFKMIDMNETFNW